MRCSRWSPPPARGALGPGGGVQEVPPVTGASRQGPGHRSAPSIHTPAERSWAHLGLPTSLSCPSPRCPEWAPPCLAKEAKHALPLPVIPVPRLWPGSPPYTALVRWPPNGNQKQGSVEESSGPAGGCNLLCTPKGQVSVAQLSGMACAWQAGRCCAQHRGARMAQRSERLRAASHCWLPRTAWEVVRTAHCARGASTLPHSPASAQAEAGWAPSPASPRSRLMWERLTVARCSLSVVLVVCAGGAMKGMGWAWPLSPQPGSWAAACRLGAGVGAPRPSCVLCLFPWRTAWVSAREGGGSGGPGWEGELVAAPPGPWL